MKTIGQDVSSGFAAIGEATGRAGVPLAGPPFLVMFEVIDEESEGDIEIVFPVAESAGERESIYLMENTFRAGREGIEHVAEALAKVQKHAAELGDLT